MYTMSIRDYHFLSDKFSPCYVNSIPQIPGPGKASVPALPAPPIEDPTQVLGTKSVAACLWECWVKLHTLPL